MIDGERHMDDVLVTLEGERMYIETIFQEVLGGEKYLYWYVVPETGGIDVIASEA